MIASDTFVQLDKNLHERDCFDCGEEELNRFIKTQAVKHMKIGISRTMVLPSVQLADTKKTSTQKYAICAFYTLTPSTISRETLPQKLAKKLPHYPVPVFLLAQLAVDNGCQGQGLGKISLVHALKHLWQINQHMRAYAIVVDCLTKSAENFYAKFGFQVLCGHNGRMRLFLPMQVVAQLFD